MARHREHVNEELLTYREACDILAIKKSTLYALVSRGKLPVVRFGTGKKDTGCTRFRRADLQAFIKKHVTELD